jgi:signal transduction histidine kinase
MLALWLLIISSGPAAGASYPVDDRLIIIGDQQAKVLSDEDLELWSASQLSPKGRPTAEEVLNLPAAPGKPKHAVYSNDDFWVRFRVFNQSKMQSDWTIGILPTAIRRFDLYQYDSTNRQAVFHQTLDPTKNSEGKEFPHFHVTIPPGRRAVFIARVDREMDFSLSIMQPEYADKQWRLRIILNTAYFAATIALLVFCLVFLVFFWDTATLLYLLFAVAALITLGTINGSWLDGSWVTTLVMFANILASGFAVKFLSIRRTMSAAWWSYLIISGASLFVILGLKTPLSQFLAPQIEYLGDFLIVAQVALTVLCSVLLWRKNFRPARFMLTGWLLVFAGALIYLLAMYGVLRINIYSREIIPEAAHFLQLLVLAIALGERMRKIDLARHVAEVRAESADQLRVLIRAICHDIVNPLSSIMGFAEMIRRKSPDDHAVGRIIRSSLKIKEIIGQVRAMISAQSGNLSVVREPLDLEAVFTDIAGIFEKSAEAKGVHMSCVFEPGLSIRADRVLFESSILGNLVSNAIKFTESGKGVRLEGRRVEDKVEIRVVDHGIGMPKEILSDIFSQSKNISRIGTSGEVGTGFGMSLVKSFVEAMGGEITIESVTAEEAPGKSGTTAILRFPMDDRK